MRKQLWTIKDGERVYPFYGTLYKAMEMVDKISDRQISVWTVLGTQQVYPVVDL